MPDLQGRTSELTATKGRHYPFIKSRIHPTFQSASLRSAKALSLTKKAPAQWIRTATDADHTLLQKANLELWSSRNKVDRFIDQLLNVYEFAEPLLTEALKTQFGVEVDVKTTYLYLYLAKETPWYVIDTSGGGITRTVSLIDAALHNFARSETCEPDSEFISQPDSRGHFVVLPIKRKMSIARFQNLCRELDIGARYTRYLEEQLLPEDGVAQFVLHRYIVDSEKAAFKAAAQQAVMTGDIDADARDLILQMLDGQCNLTRKGRVMQFAELSILDAQLTGIVLITPDTDRSRDVVPIIAYVPQDPDHPLKEYSSTIAFMNELTRQLRDNAIISSTGMSYHQYFSRFVDHSVRGHFFGDLQQRLFEVKWHQKAPLDPGPSWREIPKTTRDLQFSTAPISGEFREHLFRKKLNKILNDARHIAISTADTDRNARWAWWDNFKKIVSDIFNVALMVLTPFVPGLGEVMLAYTAYQLTHDVIEGVVDLAEGLWVEAAEHVVGVTYDVIQLIAFAAGAQLANEFKLKASSFVDGMKPVQLPNGETRLWHPDVQPYAHANLAVPEGSKPDALGLHRHAGKDVLPLDDHHFVVQKEPGTGQHRLQHPTRAEAYSPTLAHNGRGAWTHEGENPRTWDSPKLMKRLGHITDGFSATQLENIRLISGTDEDAIRRMHVEHAPPPLLLDDTLKRFRAFDDAGVASQQIRSGHPMDPSSFWFEQMVTDLPGWPSEYALKVYQNADRSGMARTYGNASASANQTLSVTLAQVMAGTLPEQVVGFLDDAQLERLLGSTLPKAQQILALRERLAEWVDSRQAEISNYLYRFRESQP